MAVEVQLPEALVDEIDAVSKDRVAFITKAVRRFLDEKPDRHTGGPPTEDEPGSPFTGS